MTSSPESVDEPALHQQLYKLRREGFEGVELEQLPDLMTIAARVATSQSESRRQLEAAMELAIGDLPQDQKAARLWFGLDHEMRGKSKEEREEAAAKVRFVSVQSFRTHVQKGLMEAIRSALLNRYEPPVDNDEVEPGEKASEVGPSYLSFRGRYRRGTEEFSIRASPWVAAAWTLTVVLALVIVVILVSR